MATIHPLRPEPVPCTPNLMARIESDDWSAAKRDTVCPTCGKTYRQHPAIQNYLWLRLICTGAIVKFETPL